MIFPVLLSSFYLFGPAAYDLNTPEIQDRIEIGLNYAYQDIYDTAQVYFHELIETYPDNPAGYFFQAALLQLKMMDECQYDNEKEYNELIEQTIEKSEDILQQEDNLWAEYYLGSSYTYLAVFYGFKGDYFKTFRHGVAGGHILQNIIKKDSTFYDAYLGAGSFEYFWARAARYLPVLKLVGGDVNEAIRKLHVAAEKSLYSKQTAQNSLVFIYGEEKSFGKADSIIDILLEKYPKGRTFLWNKAELEFKKENYRAAIPLFEELYTIYNNDITKNYSNLAQCKLYTGKAYFELDEKEKAKQTLKQVIIFKKYSNEYPRIEEYCREAYGLLSRIF